MNKMPITLLDSRCLNVVEYVVKLKGEEVKIYNVKS